MARKKHALLIGIDAYRHLEGKDLQGAHNDVIEVFTLLRDHFAFPSANIVGYIDDEESTRGVLLGAFEDLCRRVEKDDVVVLFYSGHGSRHFRDGGGIEALVPADSGRPSPDGDGSPNRDIHDFELQRYLEILRRKTPWLTAIFDCCHSGSVTRDPFVTGVREIRADPRPINVAGGGERVSRLASPGSSGGQGVTLAACRASELAREMGAAEGGGNHRHGAFTYHLCEALLNAPPGSTWRGVFEEVAPRVSNLFPGQHPQIEGERNVLPFGVEIRAPRPYVRVLGYKANRIRLAGGAAHGLRIGSTWSLHPSDVLHPTKESEIARVKIEQVAAGSSLGAALGEIGDGRVGPDRFKAGQRAFPMSQRAGRPGLRVHLSLDGLGEREVARATRYLKRSALLAAATFEEADVDLRLRGDEWSAIGKDGSQLVHARPREDASIPRLFRDLETVARYRKLLEIENRGESDLRRGVRLHLLRRSGRSFVEAEAEPGDGLPFFSWGEKMEIAVENSLDRPVWASLLHFGCDFSIDLLLPHLNHRHYKPGSLRLEPLSTLQLARGYHSDSRVVDLSSGFELARPEGFPWTASGSGDASSARGQVHLRLMITDQEADFEFLTGAKARDPGSQEHPLLELSRLYASGKGRRNVLNAEMANAEMGWAVISRSLTVGGRG